MNNQMMTFCRKDVMSVCIATDRAEQKQCYFYKRSFHTDRCMYFVLGEFCDCLKAQLGYQVPEVSLGSRTMV